MFKPKPISLALASAILLAGCSQQDNHNQKAAPPASNATPSQDKLGWMNNQELTQNDRERIGIIIRGGFNSDIDAIRAMQAGITNSLTRSDFELLHQDMRRAQAAYPDVSPRKLTQGMWLSVSPKDKIPEELCGSSNFSGVEENGKSYLDGDCYITVVNPIYPNRADAKTTMRYFVALEMREKADELARLRKDGPFSIMAGTSGSLDVVYDKKTNEVVVTQADEWAAKGKQWRIPFVPEEWVGVFTGDLSDIKRVPSFARGTEKEVRVIPSGVTITMGTIGDRTPNANKARPHRSTGAVVSVTGQSANSQPPM